MSKLNNLHVVTTGATGFVGRNLRKLLHKKGIKLVSIARKNFSAYPKETKIISSSLQKNVSLSKLQSCKCLIHLIGIGRQTIANNFEYVNVQLTKNAIELCKKAKIKKIIFISGLGVSKNSTGCYFISKFKAEEEIINSGLDYTIFRASYIIGKDDPLTQSLKNQIKQGTIMIPGSGNYHLQPIFIDDVCEVIFSAIYSKKFSNKIVDLVGPETISFTNYVKSFKKNKNAKIKKINLETAYHGALHNSKSVFGIDELNILIGDFVGNYKKLHKLSKIKFTKFREIL